MIAERVIQGLKYASGT